MDGYVTIPDIFARELNKSGIFKTDNEYVFQSKNGIKPVSKNVMGYRYRQLVKKLKLSKDYTLYSWKHSGVVSAYNAGVDIKTLQKQCRHHSLEQTYLSCKGLKRLSEIYGTQRFEAACHRALKGSRVYYGMIKNILEKNLDKQEDPQGELFSIPKHENIRGKESYK